MLDTMLYNQMSDSVAILLFSNIKLPGFLTVKFSLGNSGTESSQIMWQIAMNNVVNIE